MSAYDVRDRLTAARMLAPIAKGGKGQVILLTVIIPGVYNPATSLVTGGGPVTQTTSGLVLEYNSFIRSGIRNQKGQASLIAEGDKQLLLSPFDSAGNVLSPQPNINATIQLANGVVYTITAWAPLAPASLVIYHECNIRGAGV